MRLVQWLLVYNKVMFGNTMQNKHKCVALVSYLRLESQRNVEMFSLHQVIGQKAKMALQEWCQAPECCNTIEIRERCWFFTTEHKNNVDTCLRSQKKVN